MAKLCKLVNYCKNYCIKSAYMVSVCPGDHTPVFRKKLLLDEGTPLLLVFFSGFIGFCSFSRPDFMMHRVDGVEMVLGMVSGFMGQSGNNTAYHAARTLHLQ